MGLISRIRAWWRESTVCEKHGWHPPTHVCNMCLHEAWVKAWVDIGPVPPPKSAVVLDFEEFKKGKGR